jgi:hypothetical protein
VTPRRTGASPGPGDTRVGRLPTSVRRGLLAAVIATTRAACWSAPPAPRVCPAPAASGGTAGPAPAASASMATPSPRPPLRPMNEDLGKWDCGKPWRTDDGPRPKLPYPKGECFLDTGCERGWRAMQGGVDTCPKKVPIVTMEQLARDEVTGRDTDDAIIVRGRLVSSHDRMATVTTAKNPCERGQLLFALEAPVEGQCYALELPNPGFGCVLDRTRICCEHLPLGEEIAIVGTYLPTPTGAPAFAGAVRFARICKLPDATTATPP